MTARQTAIERMNTLGKSRQPFVFLIDFEEQMPLVIPVSELKADQLWYAFGKNTNAPLAEKAAPKAIHLQKFPLPFTEFQPAFNRVMHELKAGNSFLLNLTARTRIETSLTFAEIFQHSQATYKIWLKGTPEFVCFSPEPFVRVEGTRLSTFPMKGTLPAQLPNAREQLLSDPKETAEHYTIVDLLRNDLSQVAKKVRVERFRYLEEIQTHSGRLLQASSEIAGELPANWADSLGDWFFRLLPAGSVSGAPKAKTLQIIQEVEGRKRGFYTGVAGFFDGKKLDSGVMIRFIEKSDEGLFYRSGGGITFQSKAEAEYRELLDKVYVPIPGNHPLL